MVNAKYGEIMKYVCLLRGVNAGGNRRVPMAEFRRVLESMGLKNVRTYINSGNAIFESETPPDPIKIRRLLEETFGFEIPALVIDSENLLRIVTALPAEWLNDYSEHKSDVAFLFPDADSPEILEKLGYRPEFETLLYVPGAILSNVARKNQSRSSLLRSVGTPLYKSMTIRNSTTARKLAQLLGDV